MAINLEMVGRTMGPNKAKYKHRDTILYALGIGADESDLEFLYEKHGPRVYPSFAVIPPFLTEGAGAGWIMELGVNPFMIVHGEQRVVLHAPIPANAEVAISAKIEGIYDKGSGALVLLKSEAQIDGKPAFDNHISFFVRGEGGFGGDRGPKTEKVEVPSRAPDLKVDVEVEKRQALLYRLSGDWNPLHADPEIAQMVGFEKPILHGLCTFGIVTRAAVKGLLGNDPDAVHSIGARFAAPVLPGQTLSIELWKEAKRIIAVPKNDQGQEVLTNAVIELK